MSDKHHSCGKENIVHQLLKVQAQVKVTPLVKHGPPKVYCVDSSIKPHSGCDAGHGFDCGSDCNFTLTQIICVEIPICFDADVDIKEGILCCGKPELKSDCKHDRKHDCKDDHHYQIFVLMNNKINF